MAIFMSDIKLSLVTSHEEHAFFPLTGFEYGCRKKILAKEILISSIDNLQMIYILKIV